MDKSIQLRRKFYRELPIYQELLDGQGGVCKICRRPPVKIRLSVDHDHAVDKIKVQIYQTPDNWTAWAKYKEWLYYVHRPTKQEAWKELKLLLFEKAIRGLLCMRCNKGIQMFEDSKAPLKPAERFDAAAKYFRDFEESNARTN